MSQMFVGTASYSINPKVESAKNDLIASLTTNIAAAAPQTAADQTDMNNFNTRFTHLQAATYAVAVTWDFTYTTTRDVDEEVGDSCALPSATQSLSTFITSVVSNSQSDASQTEVVTTGQEASTTSDEDLTTTAPSSTQEPEPSTSTEAVPSTTEPEPTTTEVVEPTSTTEEVETTTEPTEAPTATVSITPLERQEIVCHNQDDFPGHADIDDGAQDEFSSKFSGMQFDNGETTTTDLHDGMPKFDSTYYDKHDVRYQYSVEWLSGCVTEVESQNFQFPLGLKQSLITAYLLVREDFTKCEWTCLLKCLIGEQLLTT